MKKVLAFFAIAAMLCCVACKKTPTNNQGGNQTKPDPEKTDPEEPPVVEKATITIDGDFEDWAKLDQSKVAVAKSDPASPWDAVKEIRCYSNEMFVFYYIEYNSAQIADILAGTNDPSDPEHNELPIRLKINTDGEFTSGYTSYSLDGYDFIVEGGLATNGEWSSFDGNLYQRINGSWTDPPLLASGNGLCSGAGKDNKYEICLIKELFNAAAGSSDVPMVMGDNFQTGIRFYTASWGELANMPDGAVDDENNPKGYGHLLDIHTDL